ncbi:MAG: hypothetical protein EKK46_06245 [Rhodocyclaceae bacterium]|nr:MAG: hypothetical protein EKK46_06245 [Rhodocyclaceae bacterium]
MLLLQTSLSAALSRQGPMPTLEFPTPAGITLAIPIVIGVEVITEWCCPRTNRRADLAVLDKQGDPVLLIEVYHTHAVDGTKASDLSPYWWIEVGAGQVLENHQRLVIINHGNFPYEFEVLGRQAEIFGQLI